VILIIKLLSVIPHTVRIK